MNIYRSTDSGAPLLEGIVGGAFSAGSWSNGSLLNLLNQVLVNGYGSQTAAGWALSFTDTSHGTFIQGSGCEFYLDVLDDGSLTAGAREASFSGFEIATAVGTGTGQFPTTTQQAAGLKFRKSETADGTQRMWTMFADDRTFYLFSWTGQATAYLAGMGFGDFATLLSGDAYNCLAIGRVTSAIVDTLTNETLDNCNASLTTNTGHYMARGYNQLGTSLNFGIGGSMFNAAGSASFGGNTGLNWPNPTANEFFLTRAYVIDNVTAPTTSIRGYLRGMWFPQNPISAAPQGGIYGGSGTLASRVFQISPLRSGASANSRYVMETSDTWD
jgi:hypothetical protein